MADVEQQANLTALAKTARVFKNLFYILAFTVVILAVVLATLFSTDQGSKFLLDRVMEKQDIISYEYESGNLYQGIKLKQVTVHISSVVNVVVEQPKLKLGWRAILKQEVHLKELDVSQVKITVLGEPSDKPFGFPKVDLPFDLRVDLLNAGELDIHVRDTVTSFNNIQIKEALWHGTKLEFDESYMSMGYLSVREAKGFIDFDQKYPLALKGDLNIQALHSIDIHDVNVDASGSLDEIKAKLFAETQPLDIKDAAKGKIDATLTLHPVRDHVPMMALMEFHDYTLPFLHEQHLIAEKGYAKIEGDIQRLNIGVATKIAGKDIPEAKYIASMHTDLVNRLDITALNSEILTGRAQVKGFVDWEKDLTWDVKGQFQHIDFRKAKIDPTIYDFFPPNTDAKLSSSGTWKDDLAARVDLKFDQYESWSVIAKQKAATETKIYPLDLNIKWQGMDRKLPYIGWLKSTSGQVDLSLIEDKQDLHVKAQVQQHRLGLLPKGAYDAVINIHKDIVKIPRFNLADAGGNIAGSAQVNLPKEKHPLSWQVNLQAKHFNLGQVLENAPFQDINGHLIVKGVEKPHQHVIQIQKVDLDGRMDGRPEQLVLNGHGAVVVAFHDEKKGGALKSIGLDYTGLFDVKNSAIAHKQANLRLNMGGTPEHLQIKELSYNSAVIGQANITGSLNIGSQIQWMLNARLQNIQPQFFYQPLNGNLTGTILTKGTWSDFKREVSIQTLNNGAITGVLNQKPLNISGSLYLNFDPKKNQFIPRSFNAQQFKIAYGDNAVTANSDKNRLNLSLNIQNLQQISALALDDMAINGRVIGNVVLQTDHHLGIRADNVLVQDLSVGDVKVKYAYINGEIPTSAQDKIDLKAQVEQLQMGNFGFEKIYAQILGTRLNHQISVRVLDQKRRADFQVALKGGLSEQQVWSGSLHKAVFKLRGMELRQQNPQNLLTKLSYNFKNSQLAINEHAWIFKARQQQTAATIVFKDRLVYAPDHAEINMYIQQFDLRPLSQFIPYHMSLEGVLDGHFSLSKKAGKWTIHDSNFKTEHVIVKMLDEQGKLLTSNDAVLSFEQFNLNLGSSANTIHVGLNSKIALNNKRNEQGVLDVRLNIDPQWRLIDGSALKLVNIPLSVAKPFVNDVKELKGLAYFDAKLSGLITKPKIVGEGSIKAEQIAMASLPINIRNLNLYAAVDETSAKISGKFESRFAQMPNKYQDSKDGLGTINALIDWKNDLTVKLQLKGHHLAVDGAPLFRAVISPQILVQINPSRRKIDLNGDVYIPWAQVFMPESSAEVIQVSPDAVLKRSRLIKNTDPWNIHAVVDVYLARDRGSDDNTRAVYFRAYNNNIPLYGQLRITQAKDTRANGFIALNRNKSLVQVNVLGQDMTIKAASMDFSGPLDDPTLDIQLSKRIQGTDVGINISKTLKAPKISFVSDGGLSEQAALNAILTGRINDGMSSSTQTDRFKNDMNNSLAAAGLSLGLGGTRQFTNQLGRTFGLQGLSLDAQGTADDTQVSITGYLSPDLYIRYGIGVFTPVNKLTLRYQASARLYVEASQSIERALDIFYNWKY